jgi:hypothetical protein
MARDGALQPIITASEVNEHAFCARSWWLSRVEGYASAHWSKMAGGREAHVAHGRLVTRSVTVGRVAYLVLVVAVLVVALGIAAVLRGP